MSLQSTLSILQLNVNSLISRKKRHEMEIFLSTNKPHIVLLNETKLKAKNSVNFRDYTFHRNDRILNSGGGTGILIKKNISHSVVSTPNKINSLETTIIKIEHSGRQIIIVAAYFTPSNANRTINTNDLNEILKLRTYPDSYIIIGGDLNSKHNFWGNSVSNYSGDQLFDWFIDKSLTENLKLLRSDLPSYNKKDLSSYLDLFIISDQLMVHQDALSHPHLKTIIFESDHNAVELKISLNFRIPRQPPLQIPNYSAIKWAELNESLDSKLNNVIIPVDKPLMEAEIDNSLLKIQNILTNTLDSHVPMTTLNYSTQIPLPDNIIKFIKVKNRLRRQLHRNKHSLMANTIRSQIRNANQIIFELIQLHYENNWKTKLSNIRLNCNTFKEINKLTKRKAYHNIPTLTDPISNNKITEAIDKANLLGSSFKMNHSHDFGRNEFSETVEVEVRKLIETHNSPIVTVSPINQIDDIKHCINGISANNLASPSLIKEIIKSRNNKKSSGYDRVPNYVLKKLSNKFIEILTLIINHSYNIGYFPNVWKSAIIAPIPKKGKPPDSPTGYRQISLLSCVSKIYEKFLLEKIIDHCDEFNIIPDSQFGFRAHHSTTHAAVILKTDILNKLNQKIPTVACLLDIEKAFDSAWIDGIIFKMTKLGFAPCLVRTIHNFLKNRYFRVRVEGVLSDNFNIEAGVPQGSLLGPILYTIFLNDIPNHLSLPIPIKSLLYADDIIIYISKKNINKATDDLNNYLKTLNNYFNRWKIKINTNKCETICFKGSKILTKLQNKSSKNLQIKLDGNTIRQRNQIKYLGIIFRNDLKPYDHIKSVLQKATIAYNSIKSILYYKSALQKKIKLLCYKQLIRPIIMYGFPAWSDLSSSQMEKIRLFERRMLRTCCSISRKPDTYEYVNNSTLYAESDVTRIDIAMVKNCIKFFNNIVSSENPLITDINRSFDTNRDLEVKYPLPYIIKYLNDISKLFTEDNKLLYYHKPLKQNSLQLVYNINQ